MSKIWLIINIYLYNYYNLNWLCHATNGSIKYFLDVTALDFTPFRVVNFMPDRDGRTDTVTTINTAEARLGLMEVNPRPKTAHLNTPLLLHLLLRHGSAKRPPG